LDRVPKSRSGRQLTQTRRRTELTAQKIFDISVVQTDTSQRVTLMKNAVLVVLSVGAALLVSIIGVTGVVAIQRANRINEEIVRTNAKYHDTGRNLEGLRSDLDATRIYVRDYMLDPFAESAEVKRSQFKELKMSIETELAALATSLGNEEAQAIKDLRSELDGYFDSLSQVLDAEPRSFPGGTNAIRRQLTVRREAIFGVARRIGEIDARRFERENTEIEESRRNLTAYLWRMTGAGVFLGVVVAVAGGRRIAALQRRAEEHRRRIEKSEAERRRLSAELVRAQEEERKHISRELHDEVGQTLTALTIEIGNIQRLRTAPVLEFNEHVDGARNLAQGTLKTVREMAMGLRPSMLDDSGLVPALRWQVREFTKRTNVAVGLQTNGELADLGEEVTTCIYRVVQEALTNCARHANARSVRVSLHGENDLVHLAIQDDGIGFDTSMDTEGLGIVGIKERLHDVGGTVKITSEPQRGTLLLVEIPLEAA
jgi:signal transduction histidine kinase